MKNTPANDETFSIRPAQEGDADSLADLGVRTFSDAYSTTVPAKDLADYLAKAFSTEQVLEDIASPDVLILVAANSNTICGYIKLQATPAPEHIDAKNPIELMRLYILRDWQGCGIGTALIDAGFRAAKDRAYKTCWLKVWEGNQRAIDFYENKGFARVGNEPYLVGSSSENVVLMVCPLEE